ncbi:hypothetical protein B0H16DRAFT_1500247 [Mycena metata]|uniref:Uncharacterized protein n=1 Tax=Mycena metata TaxID=1033252 RepID=A0AAD7K9E0_9AGAR|nr:hypothetical protein B0H16DRAFT_1500247 [Mycena metata]
MLMRVTFKVLLTGLLVHVRLASTMDLDLNRTLFTPETSGLPAGTYIATGIAGVTQLAEYLDTYPDTRITRLLVSDSTAQDFDAKHGHLFTDGSQNELDSDQTTRMKVWAATRAFEEPLSRVFAKAAPILEALSFLAYIHHKEGLYGATYPEWTDPRLEPLVQHNYPLLTHFNFPSRRHLDGAYRVLTEAYYPPCPPACDVADEASRFPALTHLRTAGNFESSTLPLILARDVDEFKFPRLTHLLVTDVGAMCELASELWSAQVEALRPLTPRNITLIVEPTFSPTPDEGRDFECENHDYRGSAFNLVREDGVHLKLPFGEDHDAKESLRRALTEFLDGARGGEGEWTLPERIPGREEWCRWRRYCADRGYQRDESEL